MRKIIAIANQKGGVGKTTTAVNLSSCISVAEINTLLVDMDPQANATSGLGIDPRKLEKTIYESLMENLDINEIIHTTEIPFLKLIPSNIRLVGAEVELVNIESREKMLRSALSSLKDEFEYIIIDCPPSLGLLTLNSLTAADSVMIPIQCEYYALEGLSHLLNTIRLVQKHLNPNLKVEGILLTMYDRRLNLSKQVSDEVKSYFQSRVFDTCIHRNVRLGEAPSHGKPIVLFDAVSIGCENYMSLAKEILNNGKETFRQGS